LGGGNERDFCREEKEFPALKLPKQYSLLCLLEVGSREDKTLEISEVVAINLIIHSLIELSPS
jgi:hypothetical protein